MGERNLNYEKAYTVGLKVMMDVLEQIRKYHYLEEVKKNILSESEYRKTKFVCDLVDAVIETESVPVLVREIESRKTIILKNFKKSVGNLLMLPSDIQKELLYKDYYYNQEFVEDIASQMSELIKQTSPFDAFDALIDYMKAYGSVS